MVTDPNLWIKNIHDPNAGESLGLHLKIERQAILAEEAGLDAANSAPGDARTEYEAIEILATLPGVAEGEIVRRAKELAKNGRFHFVPGREFDSLREFLSEIIGDEDDPDGRKGSLVSDAVFVAEQVVPFLEQHDMRDIELVVGRGGGMSSKLRAAIPQLREAAAKAESPLQLDAVWKDVLGKVRSPETSEAEIRKGNPEHGNRIADIDVLEYNLPGEHSLVLMRIDQRQRAWVSNRLGPKGCWSHPSKWRLDPAIGTIQDIIGSIKDGDLDPKKARDRLVARKEEIERAIRHVEVLIEE